jgi:hypothetical protein
MKVAPGGGTCKQLVHSAMVQERQWGLVPALVMLRKQANEHHSNTDHFLELQSHRCSKQHWHGLPALRCRQAIPSPKCYPST